MNICPACGIVLGALFFRPGKAGLLTLASQAGFSSCFKAILLRKASLLLFIRLRSFSSLLPPAAMVFHAYLTTRRSRLRLGRLLFTLLLLAVGQAQAQAPGTGGPAPAPAAVPLDGGASLLLLAGAAYGLRRLRRVPR